MVFQMDGNGSTDSIHFQQLVEMEQLAILMVMECQIFRNIPICNLQIGIILLQQVSWTMASGGMEPFLSMIGTKKILCNLTNLSVAIQGVMAKATPSSVMKTQWGTFAQMASMMIKTDKSMVLIPITTVMLIVHPTMMMGMASLMKIRMDGIPMAMVCLTVGRLLTASMQPVLPMQMEPTVIQMVMA